MTLSNIAQKLDALVSDEVVLVDSLREDSNPEFLIREAGGEGDIHATIGNVLDANGYPYLDEGVSTSRLYVRALYPLNEDEANIIRTYTLDELLDGSKTLVY